MNQQRAGIEGSLRIKVAPARGHVSIQSSRPLLACQLFEGKPVNEVLPLVPLLFNLCGQAQQTAAVRAIEAANDDPAADSVEQARDDLVDIETLREHLLRIVMDWPRFFGDSPTSAVLQDVMGAIEAMRRAIDPERSLCTGAANAHSLDRVAMMQHHAQLHELVRDTVFDADPADWLRYDADGLKDWLSTSKGMAGRLLRHIQQSGWDNLGETTTGLLHALPADELISRLDGDQAESFIAAPAWEAQRLETGPLARQSQHSLIIAIQTLSSHGLLARIMARLIEVALIVTGHPIAGKARCIDDKAPGLAQVEAARGRLCHRIVLDGDRISRYRILAPTEWNFGPDGAAAQALATIQASDATEIRAQADLLIHAIDPCVGYNLVVETD